MNKKQLTLSEIKISAEGSSKCNSVETKSPSIVAYSTKELDESTEYASKSKLVLTRRASFVQKNRIGSQGARLTRKNSTLGAFSKPFPNTTVRSDHKIDENEVEDIFIDVQDEVLNFKALMQSKSGIFGSSSLSVHQKARQIKKDKHLLSIKRTAALFDRIKDSICKDEGFQPPGYETDHQIPAIEEQSTADPEIRQKARRTTVHDG